MNKSDGALVSEDHGSAMMESLPLPPATIAAAEEEEATLAEDGNNAVHDAKDWHTDMLTRAFFNTSLETLYTHHHVKTTDTETDTRRRTHRY